MVTIENFLKIVITYMHVVTKAMLLLCCIQTMPPPVKKRKRQDKATWPPRRYAHAPYLIGIEMRISDSSALEPQGGY